MMDSNSPTVRFFLLGQKSKAWKAQLASTGGNMASTMFGQCILLLRRSAKRWILHPSGDCVNAVNAVSGKDGAITNKNYA